MAEDLERLVVQLSADFKSYENAMARASGLTRRQLSQIKADAGGVGKAAEDGFRRFGAAAQASRGNVINFRQGLAGLGLQAQDVAVQLSMGTSAMRVFGQQAPQILSAFGPLGVAIGAAAAALPILVAAFENAGFNAAEFDGVAKALNETLADLKNAGFEVANATNLFAAALQNVASAKVTAAINDLRDQLREVTADVTNITPSQITVTTGVDKLRESLNLTQDQAQRLYDALVAVTNAPMDQFVTASQNALNVMSNIVQETGAITPEMQAVFDATQAAALAAGALSDNTATATANAQALAGSWQNVLANAQGAMMAAGQAVAATERARVAQQQINNSRPTSFGGGGGLAAGNFPLSGVPGDFVTNQFPLDSGVVISPAPVSSSRGGGGRGGGGSSIDRAAAEQARAQQRAIRDAVRDVAEAQRELQRENERTADSFADIFVSAIDGSRSLQDSLRSLATELAKTFISSGFQSLLNNGSLGGLFGSIFGGARATGGPVSAGRSYLVGERGPELFVPRAGGSIVPNGGAAAPVDVRVYVDNNGNLQAFVDRRVGMGMQQVSRAVPAIVANAQMRAG